MMPPLWNRRCSPAPAAPGGRTSIIASVQDGAVRVSPYVKNYGISPDGISQGGSPR